MMIRLRTPSSTTVIACLALFLALGGSGYIAFAHGGASAAKKKKKKVKVGPQGPAGPAGKNGATVVHIRTGTGTGTASADCNPGETPTGGGAIDNTGGALKSSFPNAALDPTLPNGTWTAQAVTGTDSVTVRILCASP